MAKKTVENLQPMSEAREAINDNFTELYAQLGGGSSSGAGGSPTTNAKLKEYIDSFSRLGFAPPDAIIVKDQYLRMTVRYLQMVGSDIDYDGNDAPAWNFLYRTFISGNNDYNTRFKNEPNGPQQTASGMQHQDFLNKNLKWFIDNGYAIYYGGGSNTTSQFGLIASQMDGVLFEGELPDIILQKDEDGLEAALMLQVQTSNGQIRYGANTAGTNRVLSFDNSATAGNMTNPGTWTLGNNSPGSVSIQHFIDTGKAVYLGGSSGGDSSSGGAISAETAVMVGTTNGTAGSSAGLNDRNLVTFQGVNGVTGLTLDNDIVTLTEPGRYYIKATTGAYASGVTSTAINFITGDYAGTSFEGSTVYAGDHTHGDAMTTESSAVVDITQTTTLKVQTRCNNAKSGNGLFNGGAATLLVQRISSSGGYSSSNETWGVFDGTESGVANGQAFTIQGGNNIQSITRVAVGIYEVNMINPKPNEYYHVSVGTNPLGFGGADGGATDDGPSSNSGVAYEPTASKFRLDIRDNANNQTDSNRISFHVVC